MSERERRVVIQVSCPHGKYEAHQNEDDRPIEGYKNGWCTARSVRIATEAYCKRHNQPFTKCTKFCEPDHE